MADVVAAVTDAQALRALVLLGRCLDRSPQLVASVTEIVMADPGRLLTLAALAVAAVPEPAALVGIMSEVAARAEGLDLQRLVDDLPQRSEVLARFAVVVTERLRTSLSVGADAVATARTARLLATRLAYLGERLDEAIELAREAVEVLDTVADSERTTVAERAEASAVLANVLGEGEESITAGARAVAGFDSLPRGEYRYAGALAMALHNQSVRLRAADRLKEAYRLAERAADLTAALRAERPALFLSLDADAQDLLAMLLADTGRIEQAERTARTALDARRTLAAARPDAYRPRLAATLYNLSVICGRQGKAGEASGLHRESETLYSELDARWPGRFSAQLARIRGRKPAVPDG
jgi:tetratricopeptide (TPR) repeat protein